MGTVERFRRDGKGKRKKGNRGRTWEDMKGDGKEREDYNNSKGLTYRCVKEGIKKKDGKASEKNGTCTSKKIKR